MTTRKYYVASLKGKESKDTLIIDDLENREDTQLKQTRPVEDLEELNIDPNKLEWVVQVG